MVVITWVNVVQVVLGSRRLSARPNGLGSVRADFSLEEGVIPEQSNSNHCKAGKLDHFGVGALILGR